MKLSFKYRFFQHIILVNQNKGFTLIELLVVVIIIGVLSAASIPQFMNQIGKARETEAKTSLGTLARGQQAYHYEHRNFYSGTAPNSAIGFRNTGKYYSFTANSSGNSDIALHTAYATNPVESQARDFAIGVYFDAPSYSQTFCISDFLDNDGTSSSVTVQADRTCSGGIQIQ